MENKKRLLWLFFLFVVAFGSNPISADESAARCTCGCGGTPRPYCAHKDCQCANKGLAPKEKAASLTAKCACGCKGSPRPTCAHKNCQCANTNIETGNLAPTFIDNSGLEDSIAKCTCGCGGSPRPTCAHKNCKCANAKSNPSSDADLVKLQEGARVELVGDTHTTTHINLRLSNPGSEPIAYEIPAFTQFSPEDPSQQSMTSIHESVVTVPPNATVDARIDTVCSDLKSKPPPGPAGGGYLVSKPPAYVQSVVETATEMSEQGSYKELPMTESKALATVQQLSLWKIAAENSDKPQDQISKEGFKEEIYDQLGKKPEELSEEQKEKVDQGIENIFEQVDLTVKNSKSKQNAQENGCQCQVAVVPQLRRK